MNVWTALPRLLASSRCPYNVRFLVEESFSSSIRHFSTNTPVSTTPEVSVSHFSDLVKQALAQADSKVHTQHSAPRLRSTPNTLNIISLKGTKRTKRPKVEKKAASQKDTDSTKSKKQKSCKSTAEPTPKRRKRREKKEASQKDADSTKSKKQKSRKSTAEPIPKQGLKDTSEQLIHTPSLSQATLWPFPTENWAAEPWTIQQNDDRPAEDLDRSFPPHILEHKLISEGTLKPSVTNILVDVPTVVEHLPVARLCHGLERVLFKYVVHLFTHFS